MVGRIGFEYGHLFGIGDPRIGKNINTENLEKQNSSEIYGKLYDKITDKTGGTLDNPLKYCNFINWYLKELLQSTKRQRCGRNNCRRLWK